jgi:2-polyprenyl-6-methoxyphenol hydroxylase-like FAD-dependent oxidoreductase
LIFEQPGAKNDMSLDHAVIIGGSFAGLTSARVLSDHFDRVTIVERDEFPETWAPRKGVPQSPHVHGILKLGRETLEQLLPGFIEETESEGAILFDQIATGAMYSPKGWSARGKSSVLGYGVRRALLEHVARGRVLALPGITAVQGRVNGLTIQSATGRISGVELVTADETSRTIEADLVVDAGGRGSAAPKWLEKVGLTPPDESLINGFVGYASQWVRVPEDAWPGDMGFIAQLPMPGHTKGGILYPQDNGLHVMSLFGQAKDYPPGDEAGFMEFIRNCATPLLAQVVERSEVVSEISTSRSTANRWRHYDRLAEPPVGFVVVGDAAASFNPIFGQGITSASIGAVMLGESIANVDGDLNDLFRDFQPKLAARLGYPWQTAVGFDLQFPETVGERPTRSAEAIDMGKYLDVIAQMATDDVGVLETLLTANQTFDSSVLRSPELMAKAKAWTDAGRSPAHTDPSRPPSLAA